MAFRNGTWRLTVVGILLGIASLAARAGIVEEVRAQVGQNSYSAAEAELRDYKARHGVTPEYLEALSWVARGAAAMKQWSQAANYARETRSLSEQLLTKQKLDAEPHLPIALGAAYEVVDDCQHDLAGWLGWLRQNVGQHVALLGHSMGALKSRVM